MVAIRFLSALEEDDDPAADSEGIGAAAAGLKAGYFPAAAEVFGEVFLDEAVLVAEGADERFTRGVGGVVEVDGDEFLLKSK